MLGVLYAMAHARHSRATSADVNIARLRAACCRTAFFGAPHHAPCLLALADVEVTDLLLALARHETQASNC